MASHGSVSAFYAERSVFVTGFSGFLGKVFVEKLLRSCPEVHAVYVLIRPKHGKDVQHRLDEIFNLKLFDKLKKDQPSFRRKVIPVLGDVLEPNMGLSQSALKQIETEVSILFNAISVVKSSEHLRLSIQVNVEGVRRMIDVSRKIKKLCACIHISSAFTNCEVSGDVDEQLHKANIDPNKLLNCSEWMDTNVLDILSPHLLGTIPDHCTFTKGLAEHLILEEGLGLPLAIVRPSFIGATWREPFTGWIDVQNGITSLMSNVGLGRLRCMVGDTSKHVDIIPVDIVANLMIVSAWHIGHSAKAKDVQVYNCTAGKNTFLTWGKLETLMKDCFIKNPLNGIVRLPDPHFTTSSRWFHWSKLVNHQLPAILIDLYRFILGRRHGDAMENNRKLWRDIDHLKYFTCREWRFENKNIGELMDKLSPEESKVFNLDVNPLHWYSYVENYCLGIKKFCLHEKMADLTKAKANVRRLKWGGYLAKFIVFVVICKMLSKRLQVARYIWLLMIKSAIAIYRKLPGMAKH